MTVPIPSHNSISRLTIEPEPLIRFRVRPDLHGIISNLDDSRLNRRPESLNLGSNVNVHAKSSLEFGVVQQDQVTLSMVIIQFGASVGDGVDAVGSGVTGVVVGARVG